MKFWLKSYVEETTTSNMNDQYTRDTLILFYNFIQSFKFEDKTNPLNVTKTEEKTNPLNQYNVTKYEDNLVLQ